MAFPWWVVLLLYDLYSVRGFLRMFCFGVACVELFDMLLNCVSLFLSYGYYFDFRLGYVFVWVS